MSAAPRLEIVPLGGLGEFGMNLTVFRCGDECVIVDAGMMFPGAGHLGVEVVLPDLSFLDDCGTIHGVVLSHGHEDHVGALSYLLDRHDVPVYGTPYTLGLVRRRLEEHGLLAGANLKTLPDDGVLRLGPFGVETLVAAHSILQARMIVLRTPAGIVLHTADFKIDSGADVEPCTDLGRLAELGREGVLVLLSDSTNADRPGYTESERPVRSALDTLIGGWRGRVLVNVFGSHMHRVQTLADVAAQHRRKLALVGGSLLKHVEIAEELGLTRMPPGLRVAAADVSDLSPEAVLVVVSGSQGEPMSSMSRIAVNKHRDIAVERGDLVIHSARRIPGNEKSISGMINHLLRRGAEVVTADDRPVHVSGHASAAELALVLRVVRPRYLVPIHGEYRQLAAHARLAVDAGMPGERVLLAESGDVIEVDAQEIAIGGRVHVGQVFIDGDLDEVDLEILGDRRRIARGGIVVPVVAVHRETGAANGYPEIVARGLASNEDVQPLLDAASEFVAELLAEASPEERADEGLLRARIQTELRRFFRRRMQKRPPLVVPVIVEL